MQRRNDVNFHQPIVIFYDISYVIVLKRKPEVIPILLSCFRVSLVLDAVLLSCGDCFVSMEH